MTRPKYKQLYRAADRQHAIYKERAEAAESHLRRLRDVLAVQGQRLLTEMLPEFPGDGAIALDDLDYECALAFLETNQRMTYPGGEGYSTLYTWRGRPLLRQK